MRVDHLTKRLRQFSRNAQTVESGRRIVEEQIFSFNGFPDVKIDLLADWTANPVDNRSWQWNTASFNFMPAVLGYYQDTKDVRALDFGITAIQSWCEARLGLRDYEFANHDHATALRAENALYLKALLVQGELAEETWSGIRRFILDEASRLAEESFYSEHTNHGIEQSRILAFVAYAFPKAKLSNDWWDIASSRLEKELSFAFTPEGVHVENSPAYHLFVCNAFLKTVYALPPERTAELRRTVDKTMSKAMHFATQMVRPDGLLPIIGDTQLASPTNCFWPYAGDLAFEEFLYAASKGERGTSPRRSVGAFPKSGYLVVRDRWGGNPHQFQSAFHLIMKCGWHSPYHRHDDDLNIVLYYGEDWLVDGGLHSYVEDNPVRRYLRSKWAHNVCVIDAGGDRWEFAASRRLRSSLSVEVPMGEPVRATGVTSAYPGYSATRKLEAFRNARKFIVHDSIQPTSRASKPVQFRSLWHVPSDKDVYLREDEALIVSRISGRALRIRSTECVFDKISVLDLFIENVPGPSYSTRANILMPAYIISFDLFGRDLSSALCFEFFEDVDAGGWNLATPRRLIEGVPDVLD